MKRLLAVLLLVPACAAPAPSALDAARTAAIRDSVLTTLDNLTSDLLAGGPSAWLPYFADSGFTMADQGVLLFPSRDSAVTAVAGLARMVDHLELVFADLRVTPLGPGLAEMGGEWSETVTDTAGTVMPGGGYVTGTMRHTAAGWQFVTLHWSARGGVTP